MSKVVFVARERELSQLQTFLDRALAGHGQVCFVTGEAGTGKTALVTEFARRAQKRHDDLIVAIGDCNATTGIGDPYLPFREVLGMLTGDVEVKLAQGAITQENAGRLQDFLRISGQALLEYGPDLIDMFVPGGALASRVAGKLAQRAGWADRLEALVQQRAHTPAAENRGLDQSHIFEQYTRVLQALAAQRPLLLTVDDLQWADRASIGLLFHLGRRIAESRILLVGAYRPADVGLGRGAERHPLEPALNELKRYFGDVWVDLGQTAATEARQFVDALLDTAPNHLDESFRQALYRHTEGHPLFTIELLRDLRERGDLVRDAQGYWVAGPTLDWGTLPARVEGVIAERIGRLEEELREVLTVASVEGEEFTAEVAARIQALDTRGLVRRLSGELEKQHRLVGTQGIRRLGAQRLSLFRFQHHLFQKYLYNGLSEGERAYLHEDVGNVLEALYGGQVSEIAVQLARHFVEAGVPDKALRYLIEAGDEAARQYAHAEAVLHYSRALEIVHEAPASDEQLLHLYSRRGRALELDAQYDLALQNYEAMEAVARERADRQMELAVLMAQATLRSTPNPVYEPGQGQALLEQALSLARQMGDQAAEAKLLWNLMILQVYTAGNMHQAVAYGEQSMTLARESGLREQLAFTLSDIFLVYWFTGQLAPALTVLEEANALWRELGNLPMLSGTLERRAILHFCRGDYEQTITFSREAYRISQSSHNVWGQANSRFLTPHVYLERGQPDQAIALMEEGIELAEQAGHSSTLISARADLGWVYGTLGAIPAGLELARLAHTTAEEQFPTFRPWALAVLARLHLLNGDLTDAEVAVEESYRDLKPESNIPIIPALVALAGGELGLARGDYARVIAGMDELVAYLETRMRPFITDALYLKGQALLALGQIEAARAVLSTARSEAEALGSRRTLWPILTALSQIEARHGNAAEAEKLRRQAREIIEYIAEHAGTPDPSTGSGQGLRASFLSLPHVRAVLASNSQ